MAYSSYQSYQSSASKSRRREYENVSVSSNAYSSNNRRMQSMEVLSGSEYGNEFELPGSGSAGGKSMVLNRWSIYAGIAFLFFIVLVAPHNDDTPATTATTDKNDTNSKKNGMASMPNNTSGMTTTTTATTTSNNAKSSTHSSNDINSVHPIHPLFVDKCNLPPTVCQDSHNFTYLDRSDFCLTEPLIDVACKCLNPTKPAIPLYGYETDRGIGWNGTVEMNLELLNQSLLALNPSKNNSIEQDEHFLDVVFLGDSITEHWNGRDMGVFREKDYNVSLVFQKFFQKKNGSSVEGLALGVAGDRCQNLLWRLQHGEMPPALKPKVWWVLIGTNDLGSDSCSGDSIVVGNIRIIEEIRRQNPNTPIVINSVLPRAREELLHHNRMWSILSQVNERLACYANTQANITFFNATSFFIYEDMTNEKEYGAGFYINETLLHDYLHPSSEGAMVWGKHIVEKVLNLTESILHRP